MAFSNLSSGVVVTPNGQAQVCYMVRNDMGQVVALNTRALGPAESAVQWRQFDGGDPSIRKKLLKVNVCGTGLLPAPGFLVGSASNNLMVVTADNNHSDVYTYSYLSGALDLNTGFPSSQGMLWQQEVHGLQGKVFDVGLYLRGSQLQIKWVQIEFTILG